MELVRTGKENIITIEIDSVEIFIYILQPPVERIRDAADDMLESSRCTTLVKAEDNGGLYTMIRECWLKLSRGKAEDPVMVNKLVQTIHMEDHSIVRPETIRVGQSIKFFAICGRCSA
jgi:hypothetical protein